MAKPGEIVYDEEDDDLLGEDKYCVITGKEIRGGCQVEICDGLTSCPYFNEDGEEK